jgi:ATP adenylyltransferase
VVRAERHWRCALERSEQALAAGALVPLSTELMERPALEPFRLRRLLSRTPKHLRAGGPKPNPFLPWERALEVERLGAGHVLLLNKFPVQPGHVLLITSSWQPQSAWLSSADWAAVATVAADTGGLWFFNSCAAAGASQPHRHLQLLPRPAGESSCPLAPLLRRQLAQEAPRWPWRYVLLPRQGMAAAADPQQQALTLQALYRAAADALGLGLPSHEPQPRHPYNVLFDDDWFLMVRREREHAAGFSLNALGFAGYLLATERSDLAWLEREGPCRLLAEVATPV